ncbi:hypothetical protein [Streptomyces sp. CC208A]|uniref:hypothetical protein n=1 Tax=Streptomyces sp. CC208A TaxID=3044573 RepID=UPI0024A8C18F|nr:hypothetical protein [Streptomyces sp. CC208A]
MNDPAQEPKFLLPDYVTITRDPRTGLVLAIGGDQRAAGILQTTGGFTQHPGPSTHYHRQPVAMPVEQQRIGATAAAHALLVVGYSVYLAPELNVLTTPDGDREAALRYLARLSETARRSKPHVLAEVMAEIAAPEVGVLPRLRDVLVSVWTSWGNQVPAEPLAGGPVQRLMDITTVLSRKAREIEDLRTQAARTPSPAPPFGPPPPAAGTAAKPPAPRR